MQRQQTLHVSCSRESKPKSFAMPGEEEGEAACIKAAASVDMSCMYTLSIWSVSVCGGRCTISRRNTYLITLTHGA